MRIGRWAVDVRKASEPTHEEIVAKALENILAKVNQDLRNPNSELRVMMAKVTRAESKDAIETMLEDESEISERAAVYARKVFAGDFDWTDRAGAGRVIEVKES